ncbi:ABC transporter substrate-binding protein [soil metagenome]
MSQGETERYRDLLAQIQLGRLTRRDVLHRGLLLGLSSSAIVGLLAACGGDDDDAAAGDDADSGDEDTGDEAGGAEPTATNTPVPVGRATATPAPEEPTPTTGEERNLSDNRTFTMAFTGGVPDLDPQSAYDNQASSMFLAVYEMLLRLKGSSTFEYEPMLAVAWESNDDLTEFTFTLREGAMFHDGTACDAQAVKDSLTRFHQMGRGPVDVIARFIEDPETQMEVVDDVTIKFIMSKPEPLFLAAMASEYGPLIVSPAAVEEHKTAEDEWAHEWFAQNIVGTGPYVPVEIEAQERFVFERFPDWNGSEHFFDEIIARVVPEGLTRRQLLEAGDVDAVAVLPGDDIIALRSNPDINVVSYDTTQCSWIRLNYERLSRDMREALCWAFPYDDVIDQVLQGLAKKQGPIADTVVGFDPEIELYDTDLEQAKALFDAAGYDGEEFEYILSEGNADDDAIAQLFQASLAEIDVNLAITRVDRSALIDMAYGDSPPEERPHMMSSGWWPDYNDSYNQLFPNFHPESAGSNGSNSMFYGNAEVGDLLDRARDAETEEELVDLTSEILQIMIRDDPAAVFYAQITRSTMLRNDIRGFIPNGIYIASYNYHEMWREAT